jgi:predicted DNA-binding protein (MmcQ/YjbR family)
MSEGEVTHPLYRRLNKRHWNTVIIDGSVPEEAIRDMVEEQSRRRFEPRHGGYLRY